MLRLILILIASVTAVFAKSTKIQITTGEIDGRHVLSQITGKTFYSFQGIPYAKPPIGKLRFQAPVKPEKWNETLDTKEDQSMCYQGDGGSEDCLYLNVFTTAINNEVSSNNTLMPVMFYIHGGIFMYGSSSINLYGPDYLVDKGVVLVTVNYRLNVFGFLSTSDENAAGNAGLKDLVAALHWVQENIINFNGDPKQVTIVGHSAGAGAVQYLMQSKLARDLFHKAIAQSGSTLNTWAIKENPKEVAFKLGSVLGFDSNDSTELINRLLRLSSAELFNASKSLDPVNILDHKLFAPSFEPDLPTSFITKNSYEILKNKEIAPVPFLLGYTSEEANFFLPNIENNVIDVDMYKNNPTLLVPPSLNLGNNTEKLNIASEKIVEDFFENTTVSNVSAFIAYQSQNFFGRGIRKTVELLRENQDIYFYVFAYEDTHTSKNPGVPHVGELKYLFPWKSLDSNEEIIIKDRMTTMWTNFIKTGNPTPEKDHLLENILWPKVSKTDLSRTEYLLIDKNLTVDVNPNQDIYLKWENIFKEHAVTPIKIW